MNGVKVQLVFGNCGGFSVMEYEMKRMKKVRMILRINVCLVLSFIIFDVVDICDCRQYFLRLYCVVRVLLMIILVMKLLMMEFRIWFIMQSILCIGEMWFVSILVYVMYGFMWLFVVGVVVKMYSDRINFWRQVMMVMGWENFVLRVEIVYKILINVVVKLVMYLNIFVFYIFGF